MLYQLTPTETGVRSSTRHAPWVRQSGRGAPRLGAVSGDRRGGVTGARDDLLLRRSPRDAGALTRRGPRVRRLAIPIQLLLLPVAVPPFFEGLDLGGGRTRIPPQRQDGGPDGHAGGRGTMPGLAMRTPHHGREDLSRVAYRLEGGIGEHGGPGGYAASGIASAFISRSGYQRLKMPDSIGFRAPFKFQLTVFRKPLAIHEL